MKKFLFLLTTLLVVVTLCGCDNEKNKENIINWILAYTEKYIDDIMIIFLGFNLLLKLDWKELYVKYIGLYDELIKKEFDDDYIQFYEIEQYLK